MNDLIDVRADAVGPGELLCLGGAAILVTAVEPGKRTVDLHTCFGPALRFHRDDLIAVIVPAEEAGVA